MLTTIAESTSIDATPPASMHVEPNMGSIKIEVLAAIGVITGAAIALAAVFSDHSMVIAIAGTVIAAASFAVQWAFVRKKVS